MSSSEKTSDNDQDIDRRFASEYETEYETEVESEVESEIKSVQKPLKLINAIPVTSLVLLALLVGGLFEKSLEDSYSKIVAVKLAPAVNQSHETEEDLVEKVISVEIKNTSDRLYEALLLKQKSASDIYADAALASLSNNDKVQVVALVAKKLRRAKRYEKSLEVVVSLTQEQQETFGLIFSKAFVLAKLGQTEAAVISYKRLLTLEPQNQAAMVNLGLAYLSLQNYSSAEKIFQLGITRSSGVKKSRSYSGLATVGLRTKNYPEALLNYKKAIEYRPSRGDNWRNMGKVSELMGDHKLAKDSYQKAVALEPNNLTSRLKYASYLTRRLDHLGAVTHLIKAKSIDRGSFQVRLKLVLAYLHARKPINARKQLTLAKRNIQQQYQKVTSKAIQLYLSQNYLEAIKLLKVNIKNKANSELENYLIGMCYIAAGRLKDGKKYLTKLSDESDYYAAGQYLLAEAYIDNKRIKESIEVFNGLLARINDNAKLFQQAAKAYQSSGDYTQAISLVDKALAIAKTKQLLLQKSSLNWLNGSPDIALTELTKIIEEYPNYLRARYHLADYNHKIGNNKVAIVAFSELLDIRSSYGDAQYQLGRIYFEQHLFEQSLPLLSDYLLQKPDSRRTRMLYARAFCEMGQSLNCEEQLKLVIRLSPNYAPAIERLKKLR